MGDKKAFDVHIPPDYNPETEGPPEDGFAYLRSVVFEVDSVPVVFFSHSARGDNIHMCLKVT